MFRIEERQGGSRSRTAIRVKWVFRRRLGGNLVEGARNKVGGGGGW